MDAPEKDKKCHRCGRKEQEGEGWRQATKYKDGTGIYYLHVKCPEKVCKRHITAEATWFYRKICSRDAKGQTSEGEWLCGIHLRAYNTRKNNTQKWANERDNSQHNRKRAALACDILAELGINAKVDYNSFIGMYTGNIIIDPEELFSYLGIGAKLPEKIKKE